MRVIGTGPCADGTVARDEKIRRREHRQKHRQAHDKGSADLDPILSTFARG